MPQSFLKTRNSLLPLANHHTILLPFSLLHFITVLSPTYSNNFHQSHTARVIKRCKFFFQHPQLELYHLHKIFSFFIYWFYKEQMYSGGLGGQTFNHFSPHHLNIDQEAMVTLYIPTLNLPSLETIRSVYPIFLDILLSATGSLIPH